MERQDQISTTKRALDLELEISRQRDILNQLEIERFREPPEPPVKRQVFKEELPIVPRIKFSWLIFFLLWLCTFFVGPVIYVLVYRAIKKKQIAEISNSAEYKQKCAEAEAAYQRQTQLAEEEYQQAQHEYETETLIRYNEELNIWTEEHNKKIAQANQALASAQQELAVLYESSKIIPMQYRNIPALQYIYDMISTSDYSIQNAIDSFDKSEQRKLDEARLREQEAANQLALEQNELLDQQNAIAEKARREAMVAAVVGTVQRHNTNKALKDLKK